MAKPMRALVSTVTFIVIQNDPSIWPGKHISILKSIIHAECEKMSLLGYPVSDGGRRGQSCIFFESVLAKKLRTNPAPASLRSCVKNEKPTEMQKIFAC